MTNEHENPELEGTEDEEQVMTECGTCEEQIPEDDAIVGSDGSYCSAKCYAAAIMADKGETNCEVCGESMPDCAPDDLDRDEKDALEKVGTKVPAHYHNGHGFCTDCERDGSPVQCDNCEEFKDPNSDDGFYVDDENLEGYHCSDCLDNMTANKLAGLITSERARRRR